MTMNYAALGKIRQMMGMVKQAQDPQAMISQLMVNNPQLKQVMNIVDQYGGDPELAFRETAKQMGVDPQQVLNMMK